jgi:hypothetical protein
MAELTAEQRNKLQELYTQLAADVSNISKYVATHKFPNPYTDLVDLINRQRIAIGNLLEDKEMGCNLENLQFRDLNCVVQPHLQNMQYIAIQAKNIRDPNASRESINQMSKDGHEIKQIISGRSREAYAAIAETFGIHVSPIGTPIMEDGWRIL